MSLTRRELLGPGGDRLELGELRAGGFGCTYPLGEVIADQLLAIRDGSGLLGLKGPCVCLLGSNAQRIKMSACVTALIGQGLEVRSCCLYFGVALSGSCLDALKLRGEPINVGKRLDHHCNNGALFFDGIGC